MTQFLNILCNNIYFKMGVLNEKRCNISNTDFYGIKNNLTLSHTEVSYLPNLIYNKNV